MVDRVSLTGKIQGPEAIRPKAEDKGREDFLEKLKGSLDEVNRLQQEAEGTVQDFLTKGTGNIHEVFLAMEKADVSFRLVMKVRDKLLDAYQEVMRTQL